MRETTQRKHRKRRAGVLTGLYRRGPVYYWQREHAKLPHGRVYRSLGTRDRETANAYAGSLQKLMDRGDWDALRRFAEGKLHISTIERAVREGDWQSIKRLHQSGPTLAEQATLFLARVGATRRSRTEIVRRSALKLAREHFGDDYPMHTLTVAEAEAYLHAPRDGKPWSPNTQASHRATLAALWGFTAGREREEAEKHGAEPWLRTNPWRRVEMPTREQTRFTFFTPAQARALLAHEEIAGTPRAALLATALYAGLRRGELANLRTGIDVDIARGVINVQSRAGAHSWTPKTRHGERRVPIIPALRTILAAHVARGYAGERYFFRAEHADAPPSPSTMDAWTAASYRAAGVQYGRSHDALTLHSARHSYATWLLEHGVPVTTAARLMGDTVEVVLATYAHHMPDRDQAAIDLLQSLASGEAGDNTPHNSTTAELANTPLSIHPGGKSDLTAPESTETTAQRGGGAREGTREPRGNGKSPKSPRRNNTSPSPGRPRHGAAR